MSNSFATPWTLPSRLLCLCYFQGKNIEVSCHFLLQRIFPTQESNPGLPHCRRILYQLSHKGSLIILEWIAYPSPEDLPNPGIKLRSPALQVDSLPAEPPGKPKNTGVGSLCLLQRIFPTQESSQGLLHCRRILYQLSHQGSLPGGAAAAAVAKSLQSCPTLCDPIDGSPLGSPVPGILQARTLEWVSISFSNA